MTADLKFQMCQDVVIHASKCSLARHCDTTSAIAITIKMHEVKDKGHFSGDCGLLLQVTQALDAAQKVPKAPLSELFTDVYDSVSSLFGNKE